MFSNNVKQDAATYLEDQDIGPTKNKHQIVYVLDCTPEAEYERSTITSIRQYAQALNLGGERPTPREAAAIRLNESSGLLYVRYSHDFPTRMRRHHLGRAGGAADFTNLYKPKRLLEVTNYSSATMAKNQESIRANELLRETGWFVYQN